MRVIRNISVKKKSCTILRYVNFLRGWHALWTLHLPKPITRRRVMGYFLFDIVSFLSHYCLTVFGTRHFRVIWDTITLSLMQPISRRNILGHVYVRRKFSLYHSSHTSARKKELGHYFVSSSFWESAWNASLVLGAPLNLERPAGPEEWACSTHLLSLFLTLHSNFFFRKFLTNGDITTANILERRSPRLAEWRIKREHVRTLTLCVFSVPFLTSAGGHPATLFSFAEKLK